MHKRFVFFGMALAAAVAAHGVWGALTPVGAQATVPPETAAQLKPVLSTYNLMETFFEGPHEALMTALKTEPDTGRTWRSVKGQAEAVADALNLVLIRPLEDESKRAEWTQHTIANRDAALALSVAADEKNYALAKEKWGALVASCNACHAMFPDVAPTVAAE